MSAWKSSFGGDLSDCLAHDLGAIWSRGQSRADQFPIMRLELSLTADASRAHG